MVSLGSDVIFHAPDFKQVILTGPFSTCTQIHYLFIMTNAERKEARYQRRKAKREEKKRKQFQSDPLLAGADCFEEVFSAKHMMDAFEKCCRGVRWKTSVVRYREHCLKNLSRTIQQLNNGTFKSAGFYEFELSERGKRRHIKSVKFGERVVQRALCDYCLTPLLTRSLIYDNPATLKGKGMTFARKRARKHLADHVRKYGNEGYVLVFDFKKYFESLDHDLLKELVASVVTDQKLLDLIYYLIDLNDEGVGLGSQISQILAISFANRLDHYITEVLRCKAYQRYNDDGYIIHPSKEFLKECMKEIQRISDELHLNLNLKKTKIVKLSKGFTFLKVRYIVTPTNKIVRKVTRETLTRARHKIKKLDKKLRYGQRTAENNWLSYQSARANLRCNFMAHRSLMELDKYYKQIVYAKLEKPEQLALF